MSRTYRYSPERERTFHKPKRRAFLRCVSGKRPFKTAQAAHLRIGEIQAEGAISASVAARGLKMEGSPLMQMMSEQQRATTALNYTKQQGTAAISGAGTGLQRRSVYC